MNGKKIGYIRVSTDDQNPDRQLNGIDLDRKFIDKASGSNMKRPALEAMLDYIRDDDIVIVHSMDRLARNVKDLLQLVDLFKKKKVELRFVKENLSFNGKDSAMSNLLLMLMGAVAEFEHSLIKERQLEGIRIAKEKGRYRFNNSKMTAERVEKIKELVSTTRKSIRQIAKEVGLAHATIYKYMKVNNISYGKIL